MLRSLRLVKVSLSFGIALLLAASAFADGVTDVRISPAATTTISASGSYQLVGSVTMTANVPAINITVANVTLDLNGHTLTGVAGGTSHGISSTTSGITVSNGTITRFGGSGINISGARATIRNVNLTNCNFAGGNAVLSVGLSAVVEDCIVADSHAPSGSMSGISTGGRSRVVSCTVQDNSSANNIMTGIQVADDSEVSRNLVADNVTSGSLSTMFAIATYYQRCNIRENTVTENHSANGDSYGIYATESLIERNVCSKQTIGAGSNGRAAGILAVSSMVVGNECTDNGPSLAGGNGSGYGIFAGSICNVRDNRCAYNQATGTGQAAGIGFQGQNKIIHNHCYYNIGGAQSHGIAMTSGGSPGLFSEGNLVAENFTSNHGNAGILFGYGVDNRAHSNQCNDPDVFDLVNGVAPDSLPTPGSDLDNVLY